MRATFCTPDQFIRSALLSSQSLTPDDIRSCPSQVSDARSHLSSNSLPLTAPLLDWQYQRQSVLLNERAIDIANQLDITGSQIRSQTAISSASQTSSLGHKSTPYSRVSSNKGGKRTSLSSVDWLITSYLSITQAPRYIHQKMWFLAYQREICPTTKKEHWQGYVQFRKVVSLNAAQFMTGCKDQHMEPTYGTPEQNLQYCSKEETRMPGTEPFQVGFFATSN